MLSYYERHTFRGLEVARLIRHGELLFTFGECAKLEDEDILNHFPNNNLSSFQHLLTHRS